ncbi:MAG: polysaccharide pyruvyl transferase family protein [Blautia sp.]
MKGESECDCVKKIGILTFHKSINYGSVLQAFALSDLLSKRGYAVEIIDYEPASYSIQYRIFEKIRVFIMLLLIFADYLFLIFCGSRKKDSRNFERNISH